MLCPEITPLGGRMKRRKKHPSWTLPEPFEQHIEKLNEIGLWLLRRGFYSDALAVHEVRYNLIIDRQHLHRKRLHKGGPLYDIAICFIARQEHIPAIHSLLAALVEDTLSESDLYFPGLILPTYGILTDEHCGYGLGSDLMNKLGRFVVASRRKDNPRLVVEKFLNENRIDQNRLYAMIRNRPSFGFNKYSLADFPLGPKDERVFIGGTHGNYVVIGLIENIVIELGCQPIIANQFTQEKDMTDKEHCFALIGKSAVALFEISVPDGWQVEVEHADANHIPILCLYQGEKPSRHVSSMMKSYPNSGWKTYDDLKETIKKFLKRSP
jgi:hypothetical protein